MSRRPQIKVRASKAVAYTPFDARWVPTSARVLAVGSSARGTGVVQVYETAAAGAALDLVSETERPSAVKCATFGASFGGGCARHVAVGDFQGRLCVLDPERLVAGPLFTAAAHSGVLNSVDGVSAGGAPEVATGGQDGRACVWDLRLSTGPVVEVPARSERREDCWAVALGNSHGGAGSARCLCAGFDSGRVSIYDLRQAGDPLFERQTGKGVCSVAFDRPDIPMNKLLTAGLDARLCAYDLRTLSPSGEFVHTETSVASGPASSTTAWFARPVPQNQELFACGTGTGNLSVWQYEYPSKRVKQASGGDGQERVPGRLIQLADENLSTQPIMSADWNADIAGLAVAAVLDQTIKLILVTKLSKI